MAKKNAEISRDFIVIYDFDRFHKGQKVEGVLYPDYLAIEGNGAELKVPYKEVQYVAHCERPEARAAGFASLAPFAFGGDTLASFAAETAASFGMDAAGAAISPGLNKNLCLIGYYEGHNECWILLQDTHTFETNAFVQSLASRADTKVIHYFAGLQMKTRGQEGESYENV